MRIVLADDYALFRAGLRSTLGELFGPELEVFEVANFAGLAELLKSDCPVDLILCDLRMPGMGPAGGVRRVVELRPMTPVVIISASEDPAEACGAIEQGAKGYIFKSEKLCIVQRAIELVLAGGVYASASVLLTHHHDVEIGYQHQRRALVPAVKQLSARQRMIFERLADGKPNKQIARELGVAEGTVKSQLRTIFRKLKVQNRTQAALYAMDLLDRGSSADPSTEPPGHRPEKSGGNLKVVTSRD